MQQKTQQGPKIATRTRGKQANTSASKNKLTNKKRHEASISHNPHTCVPKGAARAPPPAPIDHICSTLTLALPSPRAQEAPPSASSLAELPGFPPPPGVLPGSLLRLLPLPLPLPLFTGFEVSAPEGLASSANAPSDTGCLPSSALPLPFALLVLPPLVAR